MVRFEFWNETPDGSIKGNCVTRAIAYGSGLPYDKVEEKLYLTGKLLECDALCLDCYSFLLDNYFEFTPIKCNGESLYEFAEKHPTGVYLVRSNGHISVLDNYCVVDIWDCRDMILTNAWKIE